MNDHHGRIYVVTGADSGIGALTADTLQDGGARVICCGIAAGADVRADVSETQGRATLVREVDRIAPDGIDGLALVAGIGAQSPATVRFNYFGTLAVLSGLRPFLLRSAAPRVVLVSSASSLSSGDADIVETSLRGDETAAVAAAESRSTSSRRASLKRRRNRRRCSPTRHRPGCSPRLFLSRSASPARCAPSPTRSSGQLGLRTPS